MRRAFLMTTLLSFMAGSAAAAGPAEAVGMGRQAIQNGDYAAAVQVLQDAVPVAAVLEEPERSQALAALHFYTALAFNGLKLDDKTREQLEQFFEFSPRTNSIDPAKFDGRFVRHFNEVRKIAENNVGNSFETAYPGYRTFSDELPRERPLDQWHEGPEMVLLGTPGERNEYRRLRGDGERRAFIEEFWERRDSSPGDGVNSFRADFLRRVAFADHTFLTETMRGSLTDRGRVFVLLGPPRFVRQSNLSPADAATIVSKRSPHLPPAAGNRARSSIAAGWKWMQAADDALGQPSTLPVVRGKVERWLYGRNQLPPGFPDDQLTFKFITEDGYGDNVLQRDHLVVKALLDAGDVPH